MSDEFTPPPVIQSAAVTSAYSSEERNWAMIGHLSGLIGLVTAGIGNIVGPLIVWMIKKDTLPFVGQEAKEALNFQITWTVVAFIIAAISFILMFTVILIPLSILGFIVAGLIPVASWILSVVAGIKAGEGQAYRYPLTLRLVK